MKDKALVVTLAESKKIGLNQTKDRFLWLMKKKSKNQKLRNGLKNGTNGMLHVTYQIQSLIT